MDLSGTGAPRRQVGELLGLYLLLLSVRDRRIRQDDVGVNAVVGPWRSRNAATVLGGPFGGYDAPAVERPLTLLGRQLSKANSLLY